MVLPACQIFQAKDPSLKLSSQIEAKDQVLFHSCQSGDGAVAIMFLKQKSPMFSAHLDWVIRGDHSWEWQVYDAIGRTSASLIYKLQDQESLTLTGKLTAFQKYLSLNKLGNLEIDSRFTGLKAAELPCFFLSKLPQTWLNSLYAQKEKSQGNSIQRTYFFDDHTRKIEVQIDYQQHRVQNICTTFSWSIYWGLKSLTSRWCNQLDKQSGFLDVGDYRLDWQELKDE